MRRGLQVLLAVVGVVAVAAGASAVLRGAAEVVGGEPFSPNVDGEFRFFSAWYVVAGALLLSAVRQPQRHRRIVLAVAGGFLLGASGRLLSWQTVGAPSGLYVALIAIEFVLAGVLALGYRAAALGGRSGRAPG